MSSTHTNWQHAVAKSNKKEQARVSKKYKGVKKVSASGFDTDADPYGENDPITDDMSEPTKHDAKQYAQASKLPLAKAKKILESTDTLKK